MTGAELPLVDVDACTLPTGEQPLRQQEFDDVFAQHLVTVRTTDATSAVMEFAGGDAVEVILQDLTEREAGCCSFFDFELARREDRVTLRIGVPPTQADVLAALVDRARYLAPSGDQRP